MPVTVKPKSDSAAPKQSAPKSATGTPSFIRTGADAKKALAEQEAANEMAREAANKPRRFWISGDNLGKDFDVTFLDGDLDASGEIQKTIWPEHVRKIGGKWQNMVCLAPNYCANCVADDKATLVAAFTVIDHTPYTVQQGPKAGTVFTDQRKLFIAKHNTLGQLNKYAQMRGGLRGVRVCLTRTTKQSVNVGDMIVPYEGKYTDAELLEMMPKDKDGNRQDVPFDYGEAAPFFTAEELKNLGIGSDTAVIGKETGPDLSSHL